MQGQFRELIGKNPFTGKKHYSPWVSVSGRVTQLFGVQVRNNKTVVRNIGDPKLEGLDGRWYAKIVTEVGEYVGPKLAPRIQKQLSDFNGVDIRQFAIDRASSPLALKFQVDPATVKTVLQQNIGPIDAGFTTQSEFVILFNFPNLK